MTMTFSKATKKKSKLRLALVGPSGSGKTYTALSIATNLGKRVAVIDTERGSASKYADLFSFDALDLESFSPQSYIDAIHAAAKAGYDVLVIDSLSHAWMGAGGALEQVDNIAKRSQSRNSFNAWREVTPLHNAMVDAIIRAPLHVVTTMRAKTEYVLEKDDRGKSVPRKVGIQPVQRDGMEYEFDVVGDLTDDNDFLVGKTRCPALAGKVFKKAGADVAAILTTWLTDGAEQVAPQARPLVATTADALEKQLGASVDASWGKWLQNAEASLRMAAEEGRLLEAWTNVVDDANRLCPPSAVLASVKAVKDDLKKLNGSAA